MKNSGIVQVKYFQTFTDKRRVEETIKLTGREERSGKTDKSPEAENSS